MKEAIERWHSTKPNDTPVSEMVRLAQWYQSRGRTDDAISTLKEAVERSNSLSDERFRCELDIARLMKEHKMPGAEIWWKKAESSAIGRDQGAYEAGPSFLYISAVSLMVMDLVREDRIDDALVLLERMNPDLADNRTRCLSAIVQHLSSSDLPRALTLLKEMPSCRMRDSTVVKVAPKLAMQDLDTALELVEMIPAGYRAKAALAIAEVVPLGKSRALDEICQQAVTTHIQPEEAPRGVRSELIELLSRLPVTLLLALEPSFKHDKELYAEMLMKAAAARIGLTDDPLWQEFTAATKPLDGRVPWGVSSLRYAVQ
ncbi:MAG: hypothetical protein GTO55_00340 [Armatimonadetes bacterium]|nr:hypothetical protein [Armatimonadota bacterium]NIN04831.1 hypothetical protein [Armatimonadota bacterium]NIT30133.1 hypothetical protein [Armatimonadota bacterium]